MKNWSLCVLVIVISLNAFAQEPAVEFSKEFNDVMWCQPRLVLSNGYTLCSMDNDKSKKLELLLFDEKRNLVQRRGMSFKKLDYLRRFAAMDITIWPLSYHEIGGKIVIFVKDNKVERKMQCGLYRIIIDPISLNIDSEELICLIDQGSFAFDEPISSRGVDSPFFFIDVDKESGYYAVIKYKYQKKAEDGSNFEIYWYSPDHKEISKTAFDYVDNKYAYGRPMNLFVNADKYIILSSYVFNSETKKSMDTKLVISKLEKGKLSHKELDYTEDFSTSYCSIRPNPKKEELEMLFYTQTGEEENGKIFYKLFFQNINPETMESRMPYILPQKLLDKYAMEKCGMKNGYTNGFIDEFRIDANGNIVAVFKKNVTSFNTKGAKSANPEQIGISTFEPGGKELDAWIYPIQDGDNNMFVSTSKNNYLFLNEMAKNMNLPVGEKHIPVKAMELANGVVVSMKDGTLKTDYLFGAPSGKTTVHGFFYTSIYDEKSKTLVVMTNTGKGWKKTRLAWVKVE